MYINNNYNAYVTTINIGVVIAGSIGSLYIIKLLGFLYEKLYYGRQKEKERIEALRKQEEKAAIEKDKIYIEPLYKFICSRLSAREEINIYPSQRIDFVLIFNNALSIERDSDTKELIQKYRSELEITQAIKYWSNDQNKEMRKKRYLEEKKLIDMLKISLVNRYGKMATD